MLLQELNFHVHLFGFQGRSAKRPSSQIGVSVFNRCLYQFTTAADNLRETDLLIDLWTELSRQSFELTSLEKKDMFSLIVFPAVPCSQQELLSIQQGLCLISYS